MDMLFNYHLKVKIYSWYAVGFNSREGGIPGSREILATRNSREIFIFPGNSRHKYYHENLTILLTFGGFLSILCQ